MAAQNLREGGRGRSCRVMNCSAMTTIKGSPAARPVSAKSPTAPAAPKAAPPPAAQGWVAKAKAEAASSAGMTPMQRHVAFFDSNHDGTLKLSETMQGLRRLGMGLFTAAPAAVFINGGLGPKTTGRLSLDVDVKNIAAAKHEGDSGVYGKEGQFDHAKFDEMFARYDRDRDGKLSTTEITAMQNERAKTTFGKIATRGEFGLLMTLAKDGSVGGKDTISKQRLQSFYDGTLFYELAAQREGKK